MEIKTAVCYSLSLPTQESMAYLRLAPLRQVGIRIVDGLQNDQVASELIREGDVVIIQREFPRRFSDCLEVIELTRREYKPLIFELDDLLFFLPQDHPDRLAHSFAPSLLPMLHVLLEADIVTVSTPKLRDVLTSFHENIAVLPNYLDDSLWALRAPVQGDPSQETLTIGYMGTNSHKPDLEYVAPVLLRLVEHYPQKVSFLFWGPRPPAMLSSLPRVEWTPFARSYKEFATHFQTQSADIFIAPLEDNLFNRCKSPLKFFEYGALGVPGVYSRLEPYESIVDHERNGLLASTLEEWEECLVRLIDDDELRFRLATQAQATIANDWLLSQNAPRWLETLDSALEASTRERQDDPLLTMLRSISLQLVEAWQAHRTQINQHDHKFQMLAAQVEEQRQTIQQLEAEILGYVLSRSWRMTRPLRMVSKRLRH